MTFLNKLSIDGLSREFQHALETSPNLTVGLIFLAIVVLAYVVCK